MAKNKFISDFEYDFLLWGLISNHNDFRVCWHCNRAFKWDLKRGIDIEMMNHALNKPVFFSYFQYEIKDDLYKIELIQNKSEGTLFIPELKKVDYLLIVRGEHDFFDGEKLTSDLNKIPGIQMAMELDIDKIKSKQNLIFE